MSTFTTTCPRCGGVTLTAADIQLWVFPDGVADDVYAFTCPDCGERVTKAANAQTARLLRLGGVQPLTPTGHPETASADLPPLTDEDVLDFRELLQRCDHFEALVDHRRD